MTTDSLLTHSVIAKDTVTQIIKSVEHHYHENNILDIVAIITPFPFVLIFMGIFFYYRSKKDKLISAERIKMIENGIPLSSNIIERSINKSSCRGKNVLLFFAKLFLGLGLGIFLGLLLSTIGFNNAASFFSMIFISIGIMIIFGDTFIQLFQKKLNLSEPTANSNTENNPKNE